ncbi:MAG: DUF1275 family protein [Planctomycetes bacterium]|nr:DUF1275 family protein [Planctomycetota bacterium]
MLLTHARSLRNQARLAISLAWIAGYTNIISMLGLGMVTSHVSGTATSLGSGLVEGNLELVVHATLLLGSFLAGAAASGVAEQLAARLKWRSVYALPITLEFVLLALFALGLELHNHEPPRTVASLYWITACAASAMGVQNATITRISSGVVRTTHVTGVLTDIGLDGVRWLTNLASVARERNSHGLLRGMWLSLRLPAGKRIVLLFSILGSFVGGAAMGTAAYRYTPAWAMFMPAAFLMWILTLDLSTPIADVEALEPEHLERLVPNVGAGDLPAGIVVYRLGHTEGHEDRLHRAPNLGHWAESLPHEARVVVLDLGVDGLIDPTSLVDLRDAKRVLRARGTRLVLSGADAAELGVLRELGVLELLPLENQCEELGPALRRARELLEEQQHIERSIKSAI